MDYDTLIGALLLVGLFVLFAGLLVLWTILTPVWRAAKWAVVDVRDMVVNSELVDGYSEWDKIWLMGPRIPKWLWRDFKDNLYWEINGCRRIK